MPIYNRYLEIINGRLDESAANTLTEDEIPMPVSENENLAVLIHMVRIHIPFVDRIDATTVQTEAAIVTVPNSTTYSLHAPGVIHHAVLIHDSGSAQGTLSEYFAQQMSPEIIYFDPAFLVAQRNIYIKVKSLNMGAANYVLYQIGYTVEKVTREAFVAALVGYH